MKTLILFGSPRQNGHTKQMLNVILEHIEGEHKLIDAYKYFHSENQINPCLDCRYCWKHTKCIIDDSMNEVYEYLEQCDNIIIATPIYFHGLPAPLKIIIDRFQVYWASTKRKDKPKASYKKAIILMSGGAKPFENQFDSTSATLERIVKDIKAKLLYKVVFPNSLKL